MTKRELKIINSFIAEFKRIKPRSCDMYNQTRNKNCPDWRTVAKILGTTRWTVMTERLGLQIPSRYYFEPKIEVINGLPLIQMRIDNIQKQIDALLAKN